MIAGRYEFLGEIGRGGMGVVVLAYDHRLLMEVALKVLKPDFTKDSGDKDALIREARVLARLTDPAIVRVYDLAETEVGLMMVLEYVKGPNFAQVLDARSRLTEPELLRAMRQICTGLAVAHQAGVIHRDLKPPNLLVAPGPTQLEPHDPAFLMHAQIKITDFGISKFATNRVVTPDGTLHATDATQSAAGTPFYMAPEQFRGQPCTPASDVYSLGIIAYQALAGGPPFMGPDINAIAQQHFSGTAPRIATCSQQTNDAIQRALAKNPAERFDTALQFLAALEAQPILVETDAGDRAAAWLSRNKWKLTLAALALVGLLAVALGKLTPPQPKPMPDFQASDFAEVTPELGTQFTLPADLDPLPAVQSPPSPAPDPPLQTPTVIRKGRILWTGFLSTAREAFLKIDSIGPENNVYVRDSRSSSLWAVNDGEFRWGFRGIKPYNAITFADRGRLWIVSCAYANILSSCSGAVFNAQGKGGEIERVVRGVDKPAPLPLGDASRFREKDAQNSRWPEDGEEILQCSSRLGVVTLKARNWSMPLDAACEKAAVFGTGFVVATVDGKLHFIEGAGTLEHEVQSMKGAGFASAVSAPRELLVYDSKTIAAVREGGLRWRYASVDYVSEIRPGPAGVLYFRTVGQYSGIHALDKNGKLMWSLSMGQHVSSMDGLKLDGRGRLYAQFEKFSGKAGVLCIGDER